MGAKPTTFQEALDQRLQEARAVMIARQRKYGSRNVQALGLPGLLDRIRHDKIERLARVIERRHLREQCLAAGMPQDVVDRYLPDLQADYDDESLRDTMIDIANYALIMLMVHDGVWGLPLEQE